MLDALLKSPETRRRLRSGPAADHIDGFAEWLHRRGYKPATLDTTLRSLAGWTDCKRCSQATFRSGGFSAKFQGMRSSIRLVGKPLASMVRVEQR